MQILKTEIKYALDCAKAIAEIHELNFIGAKEPEKSVDDLIKICKQYSGSEIFCRETIHNYSADSPIRGFCLTFDSGYEVVVLSGQNTCWKRLVTSKELFHVVMDKDEYRNPNISQLIDEVTIKFPQPDGQPDMPCTSELMAEIAAMEFLLPYSDRVALINAIGEGQTPDYLEIARRYRIPRLYVEMFMSKSYMDVLNRADYE